MQDFTDNSSFRMILALSNEENSSQHWQDQCKYLYKELFRTLPEGSIEPLTLPNTVDDYRNGDVVILFSHVIITGITAKAFADVVIEAIKNWHYYRPTAEIEIECPNGNKIKITRLPLSKLQKYMDENSHLSICKALNVFSKSSE